MRRTGRSGLALVELLVVILVIIVLAAVVLPQFDSSDSGAKKCTAQFRLGTLRSLLEVYRAEHGGTLPRIGESQDLAAVLTARTTPDGVVDRRSGERGPYVSDFPENPYSGSAAVKIVPHDPATATDVTPGNRGGWLYNRETGGLWLDHNQGYRW